MNKEKIKFEKVIWMLITVFSIIISMVVTLDKNKPSYYTWLPLLPLSFAVINFFSYGIYNNIFDFSHNLAKLIIHLLYFIRESVAIYFLYKGGYTATLYKLSEKNINAGISLMIFETCCVYIVLNYYGKIHLKLGKLHFFKPTIRKGVYKKSKYKYVGFIMMFCVLFCILAYTMSPLIRNSYTALWDSSLLSADSYFLAKMEAQAGSKDRILFTLFNVFFDFTRILFPCFVLYILRKKIGDKFICIIIGTILCIVQFAMILNENIYILITCMIIGIYMLKIFPQYRSFMKRMLIIVGTIIVVYYFISVAFTVSIGKGNIYEILSDMFQIYFPGITNIACGFNIVDHNVLNTLFFDIYEAIPFHSTLFGLSGDRLSDLYNACNGVKYTICPGIIQSYHYLGVFAPAVTCGIVIIALKTQKKLNESKDMFAYAAYALLLIYTSMTPVCYYPTVLLSRFLSTILPMLIISKFAGNNYTFDRIGIMED